MNQEDKATTFDRESTFEEKLFVAVGSVVAVISIISAVATVLEHLGRIQNIMAITCAVVTLLILAISFFRQAYATGYFVMCLALNCVLIPITFFTNGGFNSGMPFFLACTFMLSTFCSRPIHRRIASVASAVFIVLAFVIAGNYPQYVTPVEEGFVYIDYIFSFAFIAFTLYALVTTVFEELQRDHNKTLTVSAVDLMNAAFSDRGNETEEHMDRVAALSAFLAKKASEDYKDYNFTEKDIDIIAQAARFHDIGETKISESILMKDGPMTAEELAKWQQHPQYGLYILKSLKQAVEPDFYTFCEDIILSHHERYDGTGFPQGLKGDNIPAAAQIAGLADTFEGLISGRLRGTQMSMDDACDALLNGSAGGFSSRLTGIISDHRDEVAEILAQE